MAEPARIAEIARDFAVRSWALGRIEAWLNRVDGPPAMLLTGRPGSGKSSVLLQAWAGFEAVGEHRRVIATVLRHSKVDNAFDASHLLVQIIDRLKAGTDDDHVLSVRAPAVVIENINQQVGSAERVAAVAVTVNATNFSALSGLVPEAERRIRATPASEPALILIDALDQAEDEGAEEFLRVLNTLTAAAQGTGVRFLCASRRRGSIWLDPARSVTLDLVEDAEDLDGELRAYLGRRFAAVPGDDRGRLVEALVGGAQGNWLWATTNAAALEAEIAASGRVPQPIRLSAGLAGLYEDGIRRIQQHVSRPAWESKVRPLLGAVACSFSGGLGPTELRWVIGLDDADLDSLIEVCHPFVEPDPRRRIRLFHPDFGRWLLAGNIAGISEAAEHLRLAIGLTRLGTSASWGPVTEDYAASWVLGHWFSLFVLDPFHPDAERHEREVERILAEPRWLERAGPMLETIEQAGRIVPRLRLPGLALPLSVGFRALMHSDSVNRYIGVQVLSALSIQDLDEHAALAGNERTDWLKQRLPDYQARVSRAMWGGLLRGYYLVVSDSGRLEVALAPSCVVDLLSPDSGWPNPDSLEAAAIALAGTIRPGQIPELLSRLEAIAADPARPSEIQRVAYVCIGTVRRDRAAGRDDLIAAVAAFVAAWRLMRPGDPNLVDGAINVANTVRDLTDPAPEHLDLLVQAQTEIQQLRRAGDDPAWLLSLNLLGDAYLARADATEDDDARAADLEAALAAYLPPWTMAPEDDDLRLVFAIGVADILRRLPSPSPDQRDLLIRAQTEVRDRRRAAAEPAWRNSANLLGDAYRARAATWPDDLAAARAFDLGAALDAYLQAWSAAPGDDENRLMFTADVADALRELPDRSAEQVELLIEAQTEVRDRKLAAGDPGWVLAESLLGDAYGERAGHRSEDDPARAADLGAARACYQRTWEAAPEDDSLRLTYAADLADALHALAQPSAAELDLLISAQTEVRDRSRAAGSASWPRAAGLLGDALGARAATRADGDPGRAADLEAAVDAYVEAWRATAADEGEDEYGDDHVDFAIDVSNAIRRLDDPSAEHLDLRIAAQIEIRDARRREGDPQWPLAAALLSGAYLDRATARSEPADADDLAAALEAARPAWAATADEPEHRADAGVALANALLTMPDHTPAELDLWVAVQRELLGLRVAADDPLWPQSANILGDAYTARAEAAPDDDARAADRGAALDAYLRAWQGSLPDDPRRLTYAIDAARALRGLPEPSPAQLDLWVRVQTEIRDLRLAGGDEDWHQSASLLGDAYTARAEAAPDDDARVADLLRAIEAYDEALTAVPADDRDRRRDYAIMLADTVRELPLPSDALVDRWIEVQQEIVDLRRAADEPGWESSANLLGDAYALRSRRRPDDETAAVDVAAALAAYLEAWRAAAPDDEHRVTYAVDVADSVRELPAPSDEQLDVWIRAQTEIRDRRRAAGDPLWINAANLLGDAYAARADTRSDEALRVADLGRAIAAYDEALAATPADDARRLDFAIDAANAQVIHAAIARQNGRAALDEALRKVIAEVTRTQDDYSKLQRLLPVIFARLRRHEWWTYSG
ncbi:hypothetical protein ACQP2P_41840 [Dactylosporangium sp. CA-139114]|uniref:hypothetical protein n=1 Tax=Dactylosporangium sp. CA-139114 TaxID=3239931 RepID=UPI003D9848B6